MGKRKSAADQSTSFQVIFKGGANNDTGTFNLSQIAANTKYLYDGGGSPTSSSVGDTLVFRFTSAQWTTFVATGDYAALLAYMTRIDGNVSDSGLTFVFTSLPLT